MQTERRKHPRRPPDKGVGITAMSSTATAGAQATTTRSNVAVKVVDVSDKGACLVTTGRLRAGAELLVKLFVEGTDDFYSAKAVVRWAETWSKNGREADVAGIEFMKVQEVRGTRFHAMTSWAPVVPTRQDDKRKQKRRLLESSKVTCVATGLFNFLGMASNLASSLGDLSESGCQITATKKLEPGTSVKVTLAFKHPDVEFSVSGEVKYANRDTLSLEPRYATGIEFSKLAHDDEGRLMMVLRAMDALA
ncbi:MAG TPA: PilZ domain-containing protein [Planctomycetota bacterium]